jgi:pimeloyl-ACP methyl ester carboxylesterase
MDRRRFLAAGLAAFALGPVAARAEAGLFRPTRFSVTVRGSGPDVIFIPGLTASRAIWNGVLGDLSGYRCHLLQVAGFAGEPVGGNASGAVVVPVAEEIARYIGANRLAAPALVGHSMGGTLAMLVAARHPALVGRLMVVDMLPQPAGLVGASASGIRPLADSLRDMLTSSPGGRRLLESLVGSFGGSEPGGAKSDSDVVARATHELALLDLAPELPKIRAPMSVVSATPPPGGVSDPARVTRAYRQAYAAAPTARLTVIPNSGHMIMFDQPAQFRAALRAFLQG